MGAQGEDAPRKGGPDGSRLSNLEEETRRADERLKKLEAASREMKGDVELLAEATGGLRQQSAKMKEAALRVAEVVQVAARRRRQGGARPARKKAGQADRRPPRT